MTEQRSAILQAYDRVISRVIDLYEQEHGTARGAITWLAGQIGTSRQNIDNWGKKSGIPPAHVETIQKITGLKKDEIRPDTFLVEVPKKAWNRLAPKELIDQSTIHSTRGRKYG
jgi:hypothetical protein